MARLLVAACCLLVVVSAAPQQQPRATQPPREQPPQEHPEGPQGPFVQINWGLCESLQPTERERESKKLVLQNCFESIPVPTGNITVEEADQHRVSITTCALKAEGWFNQDGTYKYNRAREEIKTKKLSKKIESEILEQHDLCQKDAVAAFPKENARQINLYQVCMDFHISRICNIREIDPSTGLEIRRDNGPPADQPSADYPN